MSDEVTGILDRQPTLQTITWLLSLRKFGQLDLDPPYQRKSVWTLREKQRFLDTVFRNYPSPAIFLHRSLDADGNPTYHVVDGKQRLSTILDFADGRLRLSGETGDNRLDRKNWRDLADFTSAKKTFWNYQLTVEFIDDVHEPLVREIFSRLNQNSRRLERQELRHAKFDGWLINFVEQSAMEEVWQRLKVVTRARSRRMADSQILLEYAQVILEGKPVGFDQDGLDQLCADYDDRDELEHFDADDFISSFERTADVLSRMNNDDSWVARLAGSRNNFYSLWSVVALRGVDDDEIDALGGRLKQFFGQVETLKEAEKGDATRDRSADNPYVSTFVANSSGAATEEPQRMARHAALLSYLG